MTPFIPGLDPQEPEILPARPPEQARRGRPVHRDDSLATLGAARATLARLGVTHADWPHQRLLVVQVALRSYRLQPHRHEAALHEDVSEASARVLRLCSDAHSVMHVLASAGWDDHPGRCAALLAERARP